MPDQLLLLVFVLNIVLIILDASIGYHLAPRLITLAPGEEGQNGEVAVSSIRKMLAGVVTLYMFFNCLAYFRHEIPLMAIVSVLILLDLGGQIYMHRRGSKTGENEDP